MLCKQDAQRSLRAQHLSYIVITYVAACLFRGTVVLSGLLSSSTYSCSNPMQNLATALSCSGPSNCAPLNNVFQYMGTVWTSAQV